MVFFVGLATGVLLGVAAYHYGYAVKYSKSEVICNQLEKDKEIQKQLERLIAYGNDI